MDEHRDIYTKPASKQDAPEALPAPEPTPADLRAKTRRRTILSSSIMILLLAGAATYFFRQEKALEEKAKAQPEPTALEESIRSGREALRPTPVASIGSPELPDIRASLNTAAQQPPPELAPSKMSEVMTALRQASDYMANKEWDSAETQVRRALDLWPDMNAALRLLGAIYLQRGQFDQAILTLEKAIKGDPFSADSFNNLATAYLQRNQLERAEDLLLTALQIRPDSPVSQTNLGLLYILWGRYDQSAEHLQAAVRLMPDNHSVRNNLGVSLLRLGRYEEARTHFQHLINRQSQRPEAYFNMAITHVLERNYPAALSWLRQGAARCTPVEAQRHLMDSDLDPLRSLPEFQSLVREVTQPRPMLPRSPAT